VKIKDIFGRDRNIALTKYLIKWDKPACSKLQTRVQQFLYPFWRSHIVTVEFRIPSSRLRCDVLNWSLKIAIEVNGKQHDTFSKHFHGSRAGYRLSFQRDLEKEKWLNGVMNFTVIHIYEEDIPKLSRSWFLEKYRVDLI
jgi:hypothetical protein